MSLRYSASGAVLGLILALTFTFAYGEDKWTTSEMAAIQSLWLDNLEAVPADLTNRVADDPRAVDLGHRLFFDARLSSNGLVSCGTCHMPDKEFQDGIPLSNGVGTTNRRAMPVTGSVYSRFLFWDGRKDSQWAQALGPLESPVEHGGSRALYAHVIAEHYRNEYESIFGLLPDLDSVPRHAGPVADPVAAENWRILTVLSQDAATEIFVNIGKLIAAYERRIQFAPSRFDDYVQALLEADRGTRNILTSDEKAGLRLFIGKANCLQCHNGPLFTNQEFHNTGVPAVDGLPQDRGRITGATGVLADEFNCLSRWSDDVSKRCRELEYMVTDAHELERAYKVPSLRNVADRAPYMHAGQLATMEDVLAHYNKAPAAFEGHTELKPLDLSKREIAQLVAFLQTLSGGINAPTALLQNPFFIDTK